MRVHHALQKLVNMRITMLCSYDWKCSYGLCLLVKAIVYSIQWVFITPHTLKLALM